MKKNILVSVDRGETRVAVLEAKGSPQEGKRPKKASPSNEWKVAELYVERRHPGLTRVDADEDVLLHEFPFWLNRARATEPPL